MTTNYDLIIVGAGIFGTTAALALNARGYKTAVLDPGPLPHPLAATTDISKAVRMEYGADETYMAMVEAALPGWRAWNETLGETVFHEVGLTMLTRAPMAPGGFEYDSYHLLRKRGHAPQRLDADEIGRRFPAWKRDTFVDGFYHAQGGYAESGRLLSALYKQAEGEGVTLHAGETVSEIVVANGRVSGVRTAEGSHISAGIVLVAAGAWTQLLLPELAPVMRATGHPVFHLETPLADLFTPPRFTVFTADVANTGWYGFPLHPRERVIKIANHGPGQRLHPRDDERIVTAADKHHLRAMLADTFPALTDAPIVYTRRCLYSDTLDEHLWIDRHPQIDGLAVAAGGSGHGFKFAPILGDLIADAVEGKPNRWLSRFRWRDLAPETAGEEAARFHG